MTQEIYRLPECLAISQTVAIIWSIENRFNENVSDIYNLFKQNSIKIVYYKATWSYKVTSTYIWLLSTCETGHNQSELVYMVSNTQQLSKTWQKKMKNICHNFSIDYLFK